MLWFVQVTTFKYTKALFLRSRRKSRTSFTAIRWTSKPKFLNMFFITLSDNLEIRFPIVSFRETLMASTLLNCCAQGSTSQFKTTEHIVLTYAHIT